MEQKEYKAILIDKKLHERFKAKLVNKKTIKEVIESLIESYLENTKGRCLQCGEKGHSTCNKD